MASHSSELFARCARAHPGGVNSPSALSAARPRAVLRRARGRLKNLGRRRQPIHRFRRHLGPGHSRPRACRRYRCVRFRRGARRELWHSESNEVEMAELICRWVPRSRKFDGE